MWKWFESFIESFDKPAKPIPVTTYTIVGKSPTTMSIERLAEDFKLHIQGTAEIAEMPGATAHFHVEIRDTQALVELSALLANACQRLTPPYYSEDDLGPLWEDEHEDVVDDVRDVFGDQADEWLTAYNIRLGGKTPAEIIKAGKAYWVREIIRSIKIGAFS